MKVNLKNLGQYYDNYGHKDKQQLKEGYSYSKSDGAEAVYHRPETKNKYKRWGGGKDSYKWTGGKSELTIYKIPKPAPAPPPAAAPAPAPAPAPKPKAGPFKYSPEIQQAKERVAKFKTDSLSGEMTENIYRVKELAEQDRKYDFDSQQSIKNYLDKEQFQFTQARYNS